MISIIILVHNKLELSRSCLSSLAKALAGVEHEVFCIDNASTEDVSTLLDSANKFRNFHFIRNDENSSFSIANNRAAARSRGDYLLFLNNDVLVSPGSILAFLAAFKDKPANGVAGAKLVYPTQKLQHAGISQMLWGYASNYGAGAASADARFQQECERFAVTGAMMCLPRAVFEQVGGFDERYHWGYEDVDLCLKVRAAGYRVRYVPNASGIHFESATLAAVRDPQDLSRNYQIYRNSWDHELVPREMSYVNRLHEERIRSVAVLGTGQAASGLTRVLSENGIEITAFTSSRAENCGEDYFGRPVVPLQSLCEMKFDRLMVASQYFFEFEKSVLPYDPTGTPLFPIC